MEMAILDVIKSRREITKFEERKILDEVMEEILDAAYYAPTGNNLLSQEFIVVKDRRKLDQLESTTPFMKWMSTAQGAIVVTGRPKISKYWLQDASIACGFIWLAATELGLGLGFGAVYHSEDEEESVKRESYVREKLNIPADRRIVAILGLGYPGEKPKEKKLNERTETIFYEKFK